MATDNLNGGNSSTSGNGDNVLKDSPWGRLSEVTSLDNVSNGFASATGSQVSGAANSNSDSPYGGNPFANFGNPNASGNVFTGGTNPWASLNNSGSGGNTGSSPVSAGSTSNSGDGNFGGIDFGTASQSVSFQDRIQTDQLVNSNLSQNGINVPISNGGFGSNSSGSNPVGGSNGDGVAQVSPFDQLEQNLNDYFKPFSNGGTPDASQFGDPGKINPFNTSLSGNRSSVNGDISADDTRNSVLGSIDTTNTDTLGAQIEDKVVNLANSYTNSTPTVDSNAPIAVDDTPAGNGSVFPQLASDDGSNLAQISPTTDTPNQLVDSSSENAGDKNPSLDDFYNFLSAAQSGYDSLIGSSIPDGTPSFVVDAIQGQAPTIANIIGQYQNQTSNFISASNDGNSVITGGSENTQDYLARVAYYQGLTSQFQQNPQEAVNTLISDNQFGSGSNQFGGGSPFGA